MKKILLAAGIVVIGFSSCSQTSSQKNAKHIGGGCEGCEAIYESPIAFEKLSNRDTLPDFNEAGPKMKISGIIYQRDGKTPAKDVVLYMYHTDQTGHYTSRSGKGWERRHGYIRGWVKTGKDGYYEFYTLRPASYPERNAPQHIHPTIKEPGKNEYWIDEFLFDDDPLLTPEKKRMPQMRGGNGIIHLEFKNGMLQGKRDIILGLNVPDYGK